MAEDKGQQIIRSGSKMVYMNQKEIDEYFSRDLQFDWPEAYEPPYPLTAGEARLLYSNHTGAVPPPLMVVIPEKPSSIKKEMWSQPSPEEKE